MTIREETCPPCDKRVWYDQGDEGDQSLADITCLTCPWCETDFTFDGVLDAMGEDYDPTYGIGYRTPNEVARIGSERL